MDGTPKCVQLTSERAAVDSVAVSKEVSPSRGVDVPSAV